MKITLEIQRFDPEKDQKPSFQHWEVDAEPGERLLSVLMRLKQDQEPTLAFRKSCAHGVCGSDAMVVNGTERLACKTLIKDVVTEDQLLIRIEPLRTLPIQKDLMVDQTGFFDNYIRAKPYLIAGDEPSWPERLQSPEDREAFDEGTNCILCASCNSACPVIQEKSRDFIGPAAVVQAARFLDDSRDQGLEARLPELDHPEGVWRCENRFQCTRVCPRGIRVTRQINRTKGKIESFRAETGEPS